MKIHHTGIIIDNIEKSIEIYKKLGYVLNSEIMIDDNQYLKIAFLKSSDGFQIIELIEPLGEKSSIKNFKDGYHHICYDVSEISDFASYFKSLKIGKIFTKPINAVALENRQIIFACLNNGIFAEFILGGGLHE